MGKIILPPNYPEIKGSLIFLAGPIKGASCWQNEAIRIIKSKAEEINIASPSKMVDEVYLKQNPAQFKHSVNQEEWEQVDWETYHLNLAAKKGAIMFWLDKEETHYCERAYAQTSRFELGEWKERNREGNVKIALGIEPGFRGQYYIKYRLSRDCPDLKIYSTLEETCEEAIRLI